MIIRATVIGSACTDLVLRCNKTAATLACASHSQCVVIVCRYALHPDSPVARMPMLEHVWALTVITTITMSLTSNTVLDTGSDWA